ncbi:MAG: stage 0 sporulation family protein [Lachnospiraceae bacterium]|jgi:cell fate regulator YaaT (PSP1 superfamily)|nr:stage 0 sporulation family protein [Lachnospiraceae bacterium]
MKNVVGVSFSKPGKIYFFDSGSIITKKGDFVVVTTVNGDDYGEVVIPNRKLPNEDINVPVQRVKRIATYRDKKEFESNKQKAKEAFDICLKKIKEYKLDMNLVDVEYKFDNSKLLFYFTADGRIDFRDLVKDLAAVFRTRIELRQIGVRDEVKRLGGNGVCGRELCCCSFLNNFETVSIKMAKTQNISLNPAKISGSCGKLMCCLKYEQNVYEEKIKNLPKVGAIVKTDDGVGEVCLVETLKEKVKVKLSDGEGHFYKSYDVKNIKIVRDAEEKEDIKVDNPEEFKELQKLEQIQNEEV